MGHGSCCGPFLFPVGAGTHHGSEGCCVLGYWTVTEVYKDACTQAGGATDPGPSVEDLVRALTAQRLTTTIKPTPVSVGGYDGAYLELNGPARLPLTTCTDKTIDYWESASNGTRYIWAPAAAGSTGSGSSMLPANESSSSPASRAALANEGP